MASAHGKRPSLAAVRLRRQCTHAHVHVHVLTFGSPLADLGIACACVMCACGGLGTARSAGLGITKREFSLGLMRMGFYNDPAVLDTAFDDADVRERASGDGTIGFDELYLWVHVRARLSHKRGAQSRASPPVSIAATLCATIATLLRVRVRVCAYDGRRGCTNVPYAHATSR